jgi:folate-binding protein YgfZ
MESRCFVEGAGIVDRTDRGILRFNGVQALWFCDQLLSNQVVNLEPGAGAEALLLTPHGRITAALRLLHPATGEVLADLEDPTRATVPALVDFFEGRIFATRVTVAGASDELGLVSVLGPGAEAIVSAAFDVSPGMLPGEEEHANVAVETSAGPVVIARVTRPAAGLDLMVARGEVPACIAALCAAGGSAAPATAYEDLRVRGGLALDRIDYDEGYLPQEAALERAVHFAKGCYLGQEAVAMTQRGRIKRRIRHLRFDGDARLGPVRHAGEEVGRVTSITAASPAYAIATLRTSVALGEAVAVGGTDEVSALVEELPGTVSGPRVPSARELRESLQR